MAYARPIPRAFYPESRVRFREFRWNPRILRNRPTGGGATLLRWSAGPPPLENRRAPVIENDHLLSPVAVSDYGAWEELIESVRVSHMQQFSRANRQIEQWINVEHYRLHCVE